MEWETANREILPHLMDAQAKGFESATLASRPRIPARLAIVFQAMQDLGPEPSFDALAEWERRLDDPDDRALWLLDRLQVAARVVNEDQAKRMEEAGKR
jgi:hypothetical protein